MVVPVLCKMPFHLYGNVVALHLEKRTAKAYLYNQSGAVSFSFQASLPHIESC